MYNTQYFYINMLIKALIGFEYTKSETILNLERYGN